MPLPTERQLLDLWERGSAAPSAARADALLALAAPEAAPEALAALPLGERERALLELRRSLLGPRMAALASCPHCGERHDVEFDIDRLLAEFSAPAPAAVPLRHGDLALTLRPLTVGDYQEAARLSDAAAVADALSARSVIDAHRGEEALDAAALPADARAAAAAALAAADPLCQLTTQLECAACGARWAAELDTAAYLWNELHAWAGRLMRDVHTLAAAYGWTEDDVLRLSPWRRAAYVSLAGG